jgi:hypothetical protein
MDEQFRAQQHQNELRAFLPMNNDLNRLTPVAKIRSLQDGSLIMVTVGEYRSMVNSHHLVQERIIRLTSYWLKAHAHDGDQTYD